MQFSWLNYLVLIPRLDTKRCIDEYILIDRCLPHSGRLQRMMLPSCYIHMLCAGDGYAPCHSEKTSLHHIKSRYSHAAVRGVSSVFLVIHDTTCNTVLYLAKMHHYNQPSPESLS